MQSWHNEESHGEYRERQLVDCETSTRGKRVAQGIGGQGLACGILDYIRNIRPIGRLSELLGGKKVGWHEKKKKR